MKTIGEPKDDHRHTIGTLRKTIGIQWKNHRNIIGILRKQYERNWDTKGVPEKAKGKP